MNIGFAGVSCTGKTDTSHFVHKHYGYCKYIPELKDEVFKFAKMEPLNFTTASAAKKAKFDLSRIELQMKLEAEAADRGFISDSALPLMVEHMLYLSSGTLSDLGMSDHLKEIVEVATLHTSIYYDLILYLPYGRVPFVPLPHRAFTNQYMLKSMDAVLREVLTWSATEVYEVKTLDLQEILDKIKEVKNDKTRALRNAGNKSSQERQEWSKP